MWAGFLLFVLLNGLVWVAATSLATRAELLGAAERTLAAFVGWMAFITFPILVLGWTNRLYPWTVAVGVALVSMGALAASFRGVDATRHAQAIRASLLATLRLPGRAIAKCFAAGSLVGLGVIVSGAIILYTAWLSYLAPSSAWDGIWYHETMVGFALQTHSFRAVDLPLGLQNVNGFPRVCESMNLWFVIFTDRRFIEGINSVMSIPLMLSCFVIARRYTSDAVNAMGWACAALLMPGMVLQLRSTYVDLHWAAIYLLAVHFATRPRLRVRDALYAAAAIGLLIGTKGMALVWAPVTGLVLVLRLAWAHLRRRPLAVLGVVGAMGVLAAIAAAPTYLQNWFVFHNPIWPIMVNNVEWNIHWPGNTDVLEMNKPFTQLLRDMMSLPVPGHDWADTRTFGYGLGIPFVVLPMAALGLLGAFAAVLRGAFGGRRDSTAWNLLVVTLPMLFTMKFSPALWSARYNLHIPAALMFLAQWLCGSRRWSRAADAAAVANIITSLILLYWAEPGWTVSMSQALDLAKQTTEERATFPAAEYMIARDTAAARERELGPGDVTVFTDTNMFPSLFWNDRFTNRVIYVPSQPTSDAFVRELDRVNAKWVIVASPSSESAALDAQGSGWQRVGEASHTSPMTVAYRRLPRS